jgi:hypothetical protein
LPYVNPCAKKMKNRRFRPFRRPTTWRFPLVFVRSRARGVNAFACRATFAYGDC